MLYGTQKWFDYNKDGKLSFYEWEQWYDCMDSGHVKARPQAGIIADFLDDVNKMICWMCADLAQLEGEREDQALRTMHLALYAISSALQTQTIDDHLRCLLRAFWQKFQSMLSESIYQALCIKQLLFEEIGAIQVNRLGSFWQDLLDDLPPERRVGKDADLWALLDDTSRLYNYFRDPATPEIDYAAAFEPYWAKIRLPEYSDEECAEDCDEDEEAETEQGSDEAEAGEAESPEKTPEPPKTAASDTLYTFCMVQFRGDSHPYSYLTGGIPLAAGDFVVVPVRKRNRELIGRVTDVFTCTAQDAPYPPEQAKTVLRRSEQTAFPEKAPAKKDVHIPPTPPAARQAASPRQKPAPLPPATPKPKPPKAAAMPPAAPKPAPVPPVEQPPVAKPEAPKAAPAAESPKKQRHIPWGWLLAAAAAAAFVLFAIPALERSETDTRQQTAVQQTVEAAKPEAPEQQPRTDAAAAQAQSPEAQYSGSLPKVGMPARYLKYTTLGEPDERLNCKNFEQLDTSRQYFSVYWYDETGALIAAGRCEQREDDSEFMLKTFTKYAPAAHTGQTAAPAAPSSTPAPSYTPAPAPSSTSSSSGSIRDDYDSPEDLYEDNPWDYEDEDEAWDEWENG